MIEGTRAIEIYVLVRDLVVVVVAHAPEVASRRRGVVGLRRVRDGVELVEQHALLAQVLERGRRGGGAR